MFMKLADMMKRGQVKKYGLSQTEEGFCRGRGKIFMF